MSVQKIAVELTLLELREIFQSLDREDQDNEELLDKIRDAGQELFDRGVDMYR